MEQMNQAYKVFTRICLNNWHYIDRKVLGLNESINFFTGHSGSGKSTVIDAMQIVLYANTDGRGFFNKAAADDSDRSLIEYLRGMNDALNIPHCIQHYGPDSYPAEQGFVPENVFLERLPEIAKNAIADACTGSNPRQPSQEEMEKLLLAVYYDREIDF